MLYNIYLLYYTFLFSRNIKDFTILRIRNKMHSPHIFCKTRHLYVLMYSTIEPRTSLIAPEEQMFTVNGQ